MTRFRAVQFAVASIVLLLLLNWAGPASASSQASHSVGGLNEAVMTEGQPVAGAASDLPTDNTAPSTAAAAPLDDAVTAQHYYKPPTSSPSPSPRPLTPTERLYLPPALPKHLRLDLVDNMTHPGSHAVMFMQTASSAKVTADSIVLEDVPIDTVWFMNRPDRRTGTVPTGALLAMLLMPTADRAINADITYLPASRHSASTRPKSATISLWDPQYSEATRRLACKWKPLGKGGPDPLLAQGARQAQLTSVSLFLDSCPSNVPFICCKPPGNAYWWENAGNTNMFSCPQNYVGVVYNSACWDSHTHEESSSGSCVACHSTNVDQQCETAFPTECANGACSNSWYPAYWPFYCMIGGGNDPSDYPGCNCPGALTVAWAVTYCNVQCLAGAPYC